MNENIAETKAVFKIYKNGLSSLEVLKGINLKIKRREFLAIQGPSGAGKSTLLHILGGLDYPSTGTVLFDGRDVYGLSDSQRASLRNRKVGFIFQFYHLLPEFDVLENVLMPAILNSWWQKDRVADYAKSLLDNVGLTARIKHRINQLSGGEQQRVAIVRALINRPELLLCDEPTGNLDSDNGSIILKLLKEINEKSGTTIVMVTHDRDIASFAQRTVLLKDGIIMN